MNNCLQLGLFVKKQGGFFMSVKRIAWVEGAIVAALAMALLFIPHFMG